MDGNPRAPYVIPRYRVEGDTAFFHFLHGTVPGHQIDFMYGPEVPQGPLAQTHFGHLARLMKYIEPREGAPYAFAVGNLSRDDVQHEPGHGGLAILFALRVAGVTDHAGRDMLPYAHGIAAIDRALDRMTLLSTMIRLHRRFLEREGAADRRAEFYRQYVHLMEAEPDEVPDFLQRAIQELDDIPQPPRSKLRFDFTADDLVPRRVVILHEDGEPFGQLAYCAASIAAALYRSDIKWTSVTSGREYEIAGGTTIRLVPRTEAPAEDSTVTVLHLSDVPDDEDAMMARLFGARRRGDTATVRRRGWREKRAEQRPGLRSEPPPPDGSSSGDSQDRSEDSEVPVDVEIDDAAATIALPLEVERPGGGAGTRGSARFPSAPPPREGSSRSTGSHAVQQGPSGAFDPRRSSPVGGVAAVSASGFDPRRSSPVGGVAAVNTSGFDPRRSSPVGGVTAVSASGFDPRRSSPTTGLAVPAIVSSTLTPGAAASIDPRSSLPREPGAPSPADSFAAPPSVAAPYSSSFQSPRADRGRKGRWIIAAAAFAAIAVIVLVTVTTGIHLSEESGSSGDTNAESAGTTTPEAPATISAPATAPSAPAAPATASSAAPSKKPSKGRRK